MNFPIPLYNRGIQVTLSWVEEPRRFSTTIKVVPLLLFYCFMLRTSSSFLKEKGLDLSYLVCGCDEAGRGALAGPVFAAAVNISV